MMCTPAFTSVVYSSSRSLSILISRFQTNNKSFYDTVPDLSDLKKAEAKNPWSKPEEEPYVAVEPEKMTLTARSSHCMIM